MDEKEKSATLVAPLKTDVSNGATNIDNFSDAAKEYGKNIYASKSPTVTAEKVDEFLALTAEAEKKKLAEDEAYELQYRGDLTRDYVEPSYLFTINGVGAVCRGEITAIKARAKQGKTTCGSIFMAVALGADFEPIACREDNLSVMYVDTEQSDVSACIVARRVHRLVGWDDHKNSERFLYYTLRTMPKDARWGFIQDMIRKHHPDLLFLDGVVDLVHDFNSNTESGAIVEDICRVATENDLAIVFCLHKNKNKEDDSMRGHLGTEAVNKSFEVIQVEKSGEVFTVSCSECRGVAWDSFTFKIGENHTPLPQASAVCDLMQQKKNRTLQMLLVDIFGSQEVMTFTQLCTEIRRKLNVCKRTATARINDAVANQMLTKRDKNYKLGARCKRSAN